MKFKTHEQWYFSMESDVYGHEEFGPYDTETEAEEGMDRVMAKVAELGDGIERAYEEPYKNSA